MKKNRNIVPCISRKDRIRDRAGLDMGKGDRGLVRMEQCRGSEAGRTVHPGSMAVREAEDPEEIMAQANGLMEITAAIISRALPGKQIPGFRIADL